MFTPAEHENAGKSDSYDFPPGQIDLIFVELKRNVLKCAYEINAINAVAYL